MLNGKYVEIDRVIAGVLRDFPIATEFNWMDAVEWIGDCLSLIGTAGQYVEKVTDGNTDLYHSNPITIANYRGKLPTDIVHINQVWNCETDRSMKYSTDPFHTSYYCEGYTKCDPSCKDTYKLNNNYIFTSFETGTVKIAYKSFPTDKDGLPLIPDNQAFIEACKYYVMEKMALKLLAQEKMNLNVYNIYAQNKDWYIGKAQNQAVMPNYDRMEGIQNMFLRLIPQIEANSERYSRITNLEQRFNSNI